MITGEIMKKVISASRRTDLIRWYPEQFLRALEKYPPEDVHSIVIWTKDPSVLIRNTEVQGKLASYDLIYIHYSITGMGGSILEPGIPDTERALAMIPEVIEIAGGPKKVRLRFDPIVNLDITGEIYSNISRFDDIAAFVSNQGIEDVSISWVDDYRKVGRRLAEDSIRIIDYDRDKQVEYIYSTAEKFGLTVHACCEEGLAVSKCIDGQLLSRLHPAGEKCSRAKASGQRELCGCTKSIDIGWYSQVCYGACRYCYASPYKGT
jgi:DNA repair photolyase